MVQCDALRSKVVHKLRINAVLMVRARDIAVAQHPYQSVARLCRA